MTEEKTIQEKIEERKEEKKEELKSKRSPRSKKEEKEAESGKKDAVPTEITPQAVTVNGTPKQPVTPLDPNKVAQLFQAMASEINALKTAHASLLLDMKALNKDNENIEKRFGLVDKQFELVEREIKTNQKIIDQFFDK